MDALTIILRTVRTHIVATGVPPDAVQDALAEAERALRRGMGGTQHHISRQPEVTTAERVAQLAPHHPTARIAVMLGVSDRHVRRIVSRLRR